MTFKKLELMMLSLLILSSINVFSQEKKKYKTENVIVLIMDGPRYCETWGDSTHKLVPNMAKHMAQHGVISTNFRNNGPTFTCSGHTAICTGVYQKVRNDGTELPKHPSMFQYYLQATGKKQNAAYVIASKDKLSILTNCKKKDWKGKHRPAQDCGKNGLFSGYRSDAKTYARTIEILKEEKPNLTIVNFRQPDAWGHAGNYEMYLKTTKQTDQYIYQIFKFLSEDEHYKGKTTVFVTNDHGRHLDGRKDGFINHGDGCEGCRKINFFAAGPDFKRDQIIDIAGEQIDIPVTIGELLGFKIVKSKGRIMQELFR
ncbi:MAG: alkaline phosphatase family protein [Crocinitomicaceae bacterium]